MPLVAEKIYFFLFSLMTANQWYEEVVLIEDDPTRSGGIGGAPISHSLEERGNNSTVPSLQIVSSSTPTPPNHQADINGTPSTTGDNERNLQQHKSQGGSWGNRVLTCVDLFFELLGIVTSVVLLRGLCTDRQKYLIPWLLVVLIHTGIDTLAVVNLIGLYFEKQESKEWGWILLAIVLAVFLNFINIYVFLCVFSQYQEYRGGRGRRDSIGHSSCSLNHQCPHHHHRHNNINLTSISNTTITTTATATHHHARWDCESTTALTSGATGEKEKRGILKRGVASTEACLTGSPVNEDDEEDVDIDILWCEDLVLDKLNHSHHKSKKKGKKGKKKGVVGERPVVVVAPPPPEEDEEVERLFNSRQEKEEVHGTRKGLGLVGCGNNGESTTSLSTTVISLPNTPTPNHSHSCENDERND